MAVVPRIVATVGRDLEFDRSLRALTSDGAPGLVVRGAVASGASAFAVSVAAGLGEPHILHADPATGCIHFAALLQLIGTDRAVVAGIDDVAAAADALLGASGPQRRPIVVDDTQYLDDATAVALALVSAAGVPLVLVLEDFALIPTPLLATVHSFEEVRLHDLDDAEVAQLAADVLGGPVEPVLVRSLTRLVGGAVAAIVDVLDAARRAGSVELGQHVWRQRSTLELPDVTLRRVAAHLSTLTPTQHQALDIVSVVPALPLGVLDAVASPVDLVVLEQLGLVDVLDDDSGTLVSVRSATVRTARAQQMGRLRRREVAKQLHAIAGNQPDLVETHLATWLLLESGGSPSGAAALSAARRARLDGEVELAMRLCRSVHVDTDGVDLPILHSELLSSVGQGDAADEVLRSIRAGSLEEEALVAMARAANLAYHCDRLDDANQLLDDVVDKLATGPWAAEAIGLRGVFDVFSDDPLRAIERVERYLDPPVGREFVEAATATGPALIMLGRHDSAAELARAAMYERVRLGDQTSLSSAGLHALICAMALGESGRFDEAAELSDFVFDAVLDIRDFDGMVWAGVIRGRAQLDEGRYLAAAASFELAASAALDLNLGLQLRWARGGVLLAVAQLGDPVAAKRALDALDSCPPTRLSLMRSEIERARGWGAVATLDLRSGADRFRSAASMARANGESGLEIHALHDLVRIGETAEVDRLAELGEVVHGPLASTRAAHGDALRCGDADALSDVSERFVQIGAVVLAAEAVNQASWIERRRDRAASAERLRVRALELRAMRPDARTPALAAHPGLARLTLREREVASLASAGQPSKVIAGQLGVSVRTVDNLLQRVYRKLGVAGRSDLRSALFDDIVI
jgi:DNA-binding CsgD family transcriptional regulator